MNAQYYDGLKRAVELEGKVNYPALDNTEVCAKILQSLDELNCSNLR
jgi:hypothetical protein